MVPIITIWIIIPTLRAFASSSVIIPPVINAMSIEVIPIDFPIIIMAVIATVPVSPAMSAGTSSKSTLILLLS